MNDERKFVRENLIEAGFPARDIPEKVRAEDVSLTDWFTLSSDS